jgi:myo-inositol-1(or 4)-monophosphatase
MHVNSPSPDRERHISVTVESATAGATVATESFRTELDVETKDGKTDVVTRADRDTQRAIVERIRETFPDATIVGEENDADQPVPEEGTAWILDPIDGTGNFVRGNPRWTTSVACVQDGDPIAAANVMPPLNETYLVTPDGVWMNGEAISVSERTDPETFVVVPTIWWGFDRREEYVAAAEAILRRFGDLRRFGSAQAALSLLASGALDGVLTNVETEPWDTVAGVAMVRQAGGTVTDLEGNRWHHNSRGLVASNGTAHNLVLDAAREIDR